MKLSNSENFSSPCPLARPVVLVGMMGAGKSSVGRALAELVGAPFYDTDNEIEGASGRSIASIFADYGETEFRRLERQVIARLLSGKACILSVGGGAFMDPQTREGLVEKAFSVWLKVDHALLFERVSRNGNRPLLKTDNPKEKMEKLLAEREPVYAQADLTILCDNRPVVQTACRVWKAIQAAPGFQTR